MGKYALHNIILPDKLKQSCENTEKFENFRWITENISRFCRMFATSTKITFMALLWNHFSFGNFRVEDDYIYFCKHVDSVILAEDPKKAVFCWKYWIHWIAQISAVQLSRANRKGFVFWTFGSQIHETPTDCDKSTDSFKKNAVLAQSNYFIYFFLLWSPSWKRLIECDLIEVWLLRIDFSGIFR